jgi:hypothetical protein
MQISSRGEEQRRLLDVASGISWADLLQFSRTRAAGHQQFQEKQKKEEKPKEFLRFDDEDVQAVRINLTGWGTQISSSSADEEEPSVRMVKNSDTEVILSIDDFVGLRDLSDDDDLDIPWTARFADMGEEVSDVDSLLAFEIIQDFKFDVIDS